MRFREIERSFFLTSEMFHERFYYNVVLTVFSGLVFNTIKKHVTFTHHLRSKLATTQASDSLRCSVV